MFFTVWERGDHAVQPIINDRRGGFGLSIFYRLRKRLSGKLRREVDHSRHATPCRALRADLPIVSRVKNTCIQLNMRVGIDHAGQHIAPRSVDYLVTGHERYIFDHANNLLTVYQNIASE